MEGDSETLRCIPQGCAVGSTDILITFKDGLGDPSHLFKREFSLKDVLRQYTKDKAIELDRYQFLHGGKVIPHDSMTTVDYLKIQDCDSINVKINLQQNEILIVFDDGDGSLDAFPVILQQPMNCVFQAYAKYKNVLLENQEFIYDSKEIRFDCKDSAKILEMKCGEIIRVVGSESFEIYVKDERGETNYSVNRNSTSCDIMTAYSDREDIPLEHLLFTYCGTEMQLYGNHTVANLGIKESSVVHVVTNTLGKHLTKNAVQIMCGMNSSVDNPSFKPHLQIINPIEVNHRNHWKVRCKQTMLMSLSFHHTHSDFCSLFCQTSCSLFYQMV